MTVDPTEHADTRLGSLTASELRPRVSDALGSETVRVEDWTTERIASGSRQHAGTAHYRVSVTCVDDGTPTTCSFVVKRHRKSPDSDALIPADARREVGVYRSNLRTTTPSVFAPVRCYDVVEDSDSWWLWLADLGDAFEHDWSLDEYERAARHVGQFNGAFQSALPDADWVSPYAFDHDRTAPVVALLDERPTDPLVARVFPGRVRERFLACWRAREALLAVHETGPQTLCHFDGFPGNFALRERDGDDQTVAIDWELCGTGPPGADAAALTFVSAIWQAIEPDRMPALGERVLDAYCSGLRAAGWQDDPETVRRGYVVHLVLRWLESIGHVRESLFDPEQGRPGIDPESFVDWMADLNRSLADRADEALDLP